MAFALETCFYPHQDLPDRWRVKCDNIHKAPGTQQVLNTLAVPVSTALSVHITPPPLFSSIFLDPFIITPSSCCYTQRVQNDIRVPAASLPSNRTSSGGHK